ncbi:homing endonuclease associated repeat-containing protein [Neobacillus sp. Marseille-QA0830]
MWNKEYIRETVKFKVNQFIQKEGRVPTRSEWDKLINSPSRSTIRVKLGLTFNQLLTELGFDPRFKSPHKYDKEELLKYLRSFYEEFEKVPTADDLRMHPNQYPNPSNYQKQFGTFDNAIRSAGFESNKWLDQEFLKSEIYRFIKEHGRPPTKNDLDYSKGYPSAKAYKRIWGGVNECLLAMNLTPVSIEKPNAFSKKVIAADGDICDSRDEAFVDDFLYFHSIPHQKKNLCYPYHADYNKRGLRRCDFILKDKDGKSVYVEYAGLFYKSKYQKKLEEKILMAEELDLQIIIIYPWELGVLEEIFAKWLPE